MKMEVDVERARDLALEIEKTINKIDNAMHEMQSQAKGIVLLINKKYKNFFLLQLLNA